MSSEKTLFQLNIYDYLRTLIWFSDDANINESLNNIYENLDKLLANKDIIEDKLKYFKKYDILSQYILNDTKFIKGAIMDVYEDYPKNKYIVSLDLEELISNKYLYNYFSKLSKNNTIYQNILLIFK